MTSIKFEISLYNAIIVNYYLKTLFWKTGKTSAPPSPPGPFLIKLEGEADSLYY